MPGSTGTSLRSAPRDPPTRGLRVQPMRGCVRPGQELEAAECSPYYYVIALALLLGARVWDWGRKKLAPHPGPLPGGERVSKTDPPPVGDGNLRAVQEHLRH